jgi:chromate transporter
MQDDPLLKLAIVFAPFSFAAVGGILSILAGVQHETVDVQGWMTGREFIELFAVSRGSPGPGSMLITLIGWKVAGWAGALVATLALYLPSAGLMLLVAKVWNRYRGRAWHSAVQDGLAPIGTGLIMAGILSLFRLAGAGPLSWSVAIVSALILGFWPKVHPLILLGGGAAIFVCVHLTVR